MPMTTRKHDEPMPPTPEEVGRIIAMIPTTDANKTTRAAFELLIAYETYRVELISEASFVPEEMITHGVHVNAPALDALWDKVEAARVRLVESAR
jgi:hypothetical protein